MALQLINTGTTANDGTGDTLRTAAQKMNANSSELFGAVATKADAAAVQDELNLKLEAIDIANLETSTQLNARDTANRARANHTGTQPASSVTGLATVATSGAYSDLSGRPTIPAGFTYDQQAEPVGPVAGQTWRERSAGGLIVGVWEWVQSVAEWVALTTYQLDTPMTIGSASAGLTSLIYTSNIKRYIVTSSVQADYLSGTALDANNYYSLTPQMTSFGGSGLPNLPTLLINTSSAAQISIINTVVTVGKLYIFRGATGSPGNIRYNVTLKLRDCRV